MNCRTHPSMLRPDSRCGRRLLIRGETPLTRPSRSFTPHYLKGHTVLHVPQPVQLSVLAAFRLFELVRRAVARLQAAALCSTSNIIPPLADCPPHGVVRSKRPLITRDAFWNHPGPLSICMFYHGQSAVCHLIRCVSVSSSDVILQQVFPAHSAPIAAPAPGFPASCCWPPRHGKRHLHGIG